MTGWQPISTAPKDRMILVYYDHDADPYQDPNDPNRLTDYAALAEGGDYLAGKGWTVAKWADGFHESDGPEDWTGGYWVPGGWFPWFNGEYADQVCNATHWLPLPEPPK